MRRVHSIYSHIIIKINQYPSDTGIKKISLRKFNKKEKRVNYANFAFAAFIFVKSGVSPV